MRCSVGLTDILLASVSALRSLWGPVKYARALDPTQNTSSQRSRVKLSGDSFMLNSFFPAPRFYRSRTNLRFLRSWMGESLTGSGDYRFNKVPLAGFTLEEGGFLISSPSDSHSTRPQALLIRRLYHHPEGESTLGHTFRSRHTCSSSTCCKNLW